MGVLYNSVMLQQELKRKFVIEKLHEQGITHTKNGTSIEELSYDDLKYELVLAAFREIDSDCEAGKWF
ncbi:hypothetical protein [Neobacillus sp. 114]|uniref:hypothetical protein n=1 Tax=Neobacillus sp. 114 TaxID=3048535 RepID=UPI0024C457DE|nr:hypothetical protein [Neobacillus sp. 114]